MRPVATNLPIDGPETDAETARKLVEENEPRIYTLAAHFVESENRLRATVDGIKKVLVQQIAWDIQNRRRVARGEADYVPE